MCLNSIPLPPSTYFAFVINFFLRTTREAGCVGTRALIKEGESEEKTTHVSNPTTTVCAVKRRELDQLVTVEHDNCPFFNVHTVTFCLSLKFF